MTSTTTRDTFGSMSYGLSNVNSNNLFYGTSASSSDNVTSAARAFTSMSLKNGDSLKNYDWDAAEVAHLLANDSMVDPSSVTRPVSANQRAGSFLNNGAFGGTQASGFMENPFASSSSSSGRSRFECSCDSGVPHPPLSPFPPGSPVLHYAVRNQPNWTAGGVSAERNNRSNPLRTRADSNNWSSYPSQPAKPVNGHYASPWSPASDTYSSRSSKSSPEYPQNDKSAGRHQNPYADYGRQLVQEMPFGQHRCHSTASSVASFGGQSLLYGGGSSNSNDYFGSSSSNTARSSQSGFSNGIQSNNRQVNHRDGYDRDRGTAHSSSRSGCQSASSSSFGGKTAPKVPTDRQLVPRKELEMLSRFGETGASPGQLDSPHGFCLGVKGEIIVADTMNNRIQIFDQKGALLMSWGTSGYRKGRLWQPRKVAFIEDMNRVVVSDRGRECSRLQIFSREGVYLTQVRQVRGALFVGLTVYRGLIVAVENQPSQCMVMTQEGRILFNFSLEQSMDEPSDILVHNDTFYICDFLGHCVCVFDNQGKQLQRIGSEFPGIIFYPNGIDVSDTGDVIVADTHGNRFHISVWSPQGKLMADYELPHMKVSRCCGLFLTDEGNLITAATNNNIVLITNLLHDFEATSDAVGQSNSSLEWQNASNTLTDATTNYR